MSGTARGIMPFITGSGGPRVRYGRLNASEAFREGALVGINDEGEVEEFPVDGSPAILTDVFTLASSGILGGISAMDGDTTRTDGFARTGGTAGGAADLISYYPWNDGNLFITKNFWATGDPTTASIPAGTSVGDDYLIVARASDDLWGLELTAGVQGTNPTATIHQVLNVRMEPILADDTTTGKWVVFEIKAGVEQAN
jgi:hypothetical protein